MLIIWPWVINEKCNEMVHYLSQEVDVKWYQILRWLTDRKGRKWKLSLQPNPKDNRAIGSTWSEGNQSFMKPRSYYICACISQGCIKIVCEWGTSYARQTGHIIPGRCKENEQCIHWNYPEKSALAEETTPSHESKVQCGRGLQGGREGERFTDV